MRELRAPRLSEDGTHVLLRDALDQEYAVRADDLRASVPPARRETSMDSALRPKDIQARIRAGEAVESVADAAQAPVERIMVYVLPVLAEREHVALRARSAAVRRRHAGAPSRLLGDAVAHQLRAAGSDPVEATWDAWRRDDGRWTVTVDPGSGQPVGTYRFDVPGRYAVAEDDAGRALIGDVPPTPAEDADEMAIALAVSEQSADDVRADAGAEPDPDDAPADDAPTDDEPPPALTYVDEPVRIDDGDAAARDAEGKLTLDDLTGGAIDEPAPRKRRDRKRPSIPSWDEIMFGGKSDT